MKRLVISLVSAAACWGFVLASGTARPSSIGVYFDLQATTACAEQRPVTQGTAYILALVGADLGGILGAEFRVDGMPSSRSPTALPSVGSTSIGNPLTGGCNIAFLCQASAVVLPYTVHYTVVSDLTVHLRVHEHSTPSNFPCPLLICECDQPSDCFVCVPGGTAAINDPAFCLVGVVPSTWSRVKSLYEH